MRRNRANVLSKSPEVLAQYFKKDFFLDLEGQDLSGLKAECARLRVTPRKLAAIQKRYSKSKYVFQDFWNDFFKNRRLAKRPKRSSPASLGPAQPPPQAEVLPQSARQVDTKRGPVRVPAPQRAGAQGAGRDSGEGAREAETGPEPTAGLQEETEGVALARESEAQEGESPAPLSEAAPETGAEPPEPTSLRKTEKKKTARRKAKEPSRGNVFRGTDFGSLAGESPPAPRELPAFAPGKRAEKKDAAPPSKPGRRRPRARAQEAELPVLAKAKKFPSTRRFREEGGKATLKRKKTLLEEQLFKQKPKSQRKRSKLRPSATRKGKKGPGSLRKAFAGRAPKSLPKKKSLRPGEGLSLTIHERKKSLLRQMQKATRSSPAKAKRRPRRKETPLRPAQSKRPH